MSRAARTPFVGSLSIHIILALALIALREPADAPVGTVVASETVPPLVYVHVHGGSAAGGGGGGERSLAPIQRAAARGSGDRSAPLRPQAQPTMESVAPNLEIHTPVLSAVPAYAATEFTRGLIEPSLPESGSRGSGDDDGAGTGDGAGAGPGHGEGVGSGSGRETGGDVHRLGDGVTAPTPIRLVRPQYTTAAMSARLSGAALIECVVLPDGSVTNVRIKRSLDAALGLDDEAVKAARQWRFRPGTLKGQPVAVRITIELSFSIY